MLVQLPRPDAAETDGFLRRIVEAVVEPIFVKDAERRFVLMNEACCVLLGVEREELIGARGNPQLPPDRPLDEEILRTGEDQLCVQRIWDPLGRPRSVTVHKLLYRDPGGTPYIIGLPQEERPAAGAGSATPCGLRRELQQALRREELAVHYQPIVSLDSGRIEGAEALVRWPHPTRGLLLPDEFLGVAEETGLILPLGEWVLRTACHQAGRWLRDGLIGDDFTLNVNLSPRQMRDPNLLRYTREILAESALPAPILQLEISELMAAKETARACGLRDLGVRLAIDDFGTGYATFSSLRELPVNTVKIAGVFTARLGADALDLRLIRTILALVHDVGLSCVAEGIETSQQWALLRELRCELGQGFYFHRPMPEHGFATLLPTGPGTAEPAAPLRRTA